MGAGPACGLLAIFGLWAAGLLLSFALNYSQIASVAGKARDRYYPPSVSDYQLTALHALRNEAGRLVHDGQNGAPTVSALWSGPSSATIRRRPAGTVWRIIA